MDDIKENEQLTEPATEQLAADETDNEPVVEAGPEPAEVTEEKKKKKLPKWLRRMIRFFIKLILIAGIGWAVWTYVGNIYITHDNNMYPSIKDGDLVITYKLEDYYEEDVVLFEKDGKMYLGRIVAKGGDVVNIQEDGLFTINGMTPYETVFYTTAPAEENGVAFPYEVGEGEFFVLNDMREISLDSRVLGGIPEESLRGKVVFTVRHRGI